MRDTRPMSAGCAGRVTRAMSDTAVPAPISTRTIRGQAPSAPEPAELLPIEPAGPPCPALEPDPLPPLDPLPLPDPRDPLPPPCACAYEIGKQKTHKHINRQQSRLLSESPLNQPEIGIIQKPPSCRTLKNSS